MKVAEAAPRLTPRQIKRRKRRRELIQAAMEITIENGLEGLTIARLANRVDAAVGALYRYFDSKESLIVALQKEAILEFDALVRSRFELAAEVLASDTLPKAHALAGIMVAFETYSVQAHRAPHRHRLMQAFLTSLNPILSREQALDVETVVQPILILCAEKLALAVQVQALRPGDSELRTRLAWAALQGLEGFRKRDRFQPDAYTVDVLRGHLYGTLLLGWGATSEDIEAAERIFHQLEEHLNNLDLPE